MHAMPVKKPLIGGEVDCHKKKCPPGCCEGNELFCLSIPCPVTLVILGFEIELEIPCIRLRAGFDLTEANSRASLANALKGLASAVEG